MPGKVATCFSERKRYRTCRVNSFDSPAWFCSPHALWADRATLAPLAPLLDCRPPAAAAVRAPLALSKLLLPSASNGNARLTSAFDTSKNPADRTPESSPPCGVDCKKRTTNHKKGRRRASAYKCGPDRQSHCGNRRVRRLPECAFEERSESQLPPEQSGQIRQLAHSCPL